MLTQPRDRGSGLDFQRVNAAALSNLETLLPRLLPGGRFNGSEYVCGSINGGPGGSCSTNRKNCVGSDFATGEKWNDPVSLFAAVHGLKQGDAARRLADELGIDPGGNASVSRPNRADDWTPILPVPSDAPVPQFTHPQHGNTSAHWCYADAADRPLGYAIRFDPPGGKKQVLPLTYCQNPNGSMRWRWKSFPYPRPLYGLERLAAAKPAALVLLVEGEKCADAGTRLVPGAVCMTWPGGCKAVSKTDFAPLADRRVAIWPDNDAPGFKAALELADRVKEAGAVEVVIIAPSDGVAEGWDIADALAEGWDKAKTTAHIKAHKMDAAAFEKLARERYGIEAKAPEDAQAEIPQPCVPVPFEDQSPPPIPPEIVPGILRDFPLALAESVQIPFELAFANALGVVAVAAQRKFRVQVRDGYSEGLNIYALTTVRLRAHKKVQNLLVLCYGCVA